MAEPTSCCVDPGGYCARVDTWFNRPDVHVTDVAWTEAHERLQLTVETHPQVVGCQGCGVVATGHGRRVRRVRAVRDQRTGHRQFGAS